MRDIDYEHGPKRAEADRPALERVYRSGAVNQGTHLDKVAIIDLRGPDPGAFHDVYRTYAMRARLVREHGTAANQVLWRGQTPLLGDADFTSEAIVAMDEWLAAIEQPTRATCRWRGRSSQDKPEDLVDRCTDGAGPRRPAGIGVRQHGAELLRLRASRPACRSPTTRSSASCSRCAATTTARSSSPTRSSRSCGRPSPTGVCDYAKPGTDRTPTVPWLSYADGPGGKSLGRADRSASFGCLARRSPVGTRNVGRVSLRASRGRLTSRVPGPGRTTRRSWRWCVKGDQGQVFAAFTAKGRVALVATTGRAHGNRRLRPGMPARRIRAAYPRVLTLGRGLWRAGPRSTRLILVRRGRVRAIVVAPRGLIARPKSLRRYLRLAGL